MRLFTLGMMGLILSCTEYSNKSDLNSSSRLQRPIFGVNLPPMAGATNDGAFSPGVYHYDYPFDSFERDEDRHWLLIEDGEGDGVTSGLGFNGFRIPINVESSHDLATLHKIKSYFQQVGDRGVLCMFDTNQGDEVSHGNGRINDVNDIAQAWAQIHRVFGNSPGVKYEVFNEPFGYHKAGNKYEYNDSDAVKEYLEGAVFPIIEEVDRLLMVAGLEKVPAERWIISGMGYASHMKPVIRYFDQRPEVFKYDLSYHLYPNYLPEGERERASFDWLIRDQIGNVNHKIHITEYGFQLRYDTGYPGSIFDQPQLPDTPVNHQNANANTALAVLDVIGSLHNVAGIYHWHGWDNDDSYSTLSPENNEGAGMLKNIKDALYR